MANVQRGHYHPYISEALIQQWLRIFALHDEISRYRPPTEEQLRDSIETEFIRLRAMEGNNHQTDAALRTFVKKTFFGLGLSDATRTGLEYGARVMAEYTSVTVLSHILCEAIINEVVAYGLGTTGAASLFTFIENGNFLDKWTEAPKAFAPSYVLPKHCGMYETLRRLNKHRNTIVHHKISLAVDGEQILQGAKLEVGNLNTSFDWMHRFASLPYDLAEHVRLHIGNDFVTPEIQRGEIPKALQHAAV